MPTAEQEATTACRKQALEALAHHHPLVAQDLCACLSPDALEAVPANYSTSRVTVVPQRQHHLIIGVENPFAEVEYRKQVGAEMMLLRVFDAPWKLARFLDHEAAAAVISDPRWQPWLLLPAKNSSSIRGYFETLPARDWPWSIATPTDNTPLDAGVAKQFDNDIEAALAQCEAEAYAELAKLYVDAPDTASVLREAKRPLRIIVVAAEKSVYQQFSARDVHAAFTELGIDSTLCLLESQRACWLELLHQMAQQRPDALFVFSKHRKHFTSLPPQLSLLIWDQDFACSPDNTLAQHMGPRDRLWTLLEEWSTQITDRGIAPGRVKHLNLGANTAVFHPPQTACPCEYEVLFIGNIHPFEQYRKMIALDAWAEPSRHLMLHARGRLLKWMLNCDKDEPYIIPDLESFLMESARQLNMTVRRDEPGWLSMAHYFRYRIAHYVVRQRVIESLADFKLGLYGNGWEHFPAVAHLAQPAIDNGKPMLEVMHRSAIHVQLQTWTVHHARLYDTASAQGFLLVGRVPEAYPLDRVFTIGEELDTFGSIAQLHEKIHHYLDDPDARETIARRAAERVAAQHTMTHRARHILEQLKHDAA